MPLWKTTTICAALLISAHIAPQTMAQRLTPLKPLPLPPISVARNTDMEQSILETIAPPSTAPAVPRKARSLNLLKPIAAPGAPIVKLARRPVFRAKPAEAAKPLSETAQLDLNKSLIKELVNAVSVPGAKAGATVPQPVTNPDIVGKLPAKKSVQKPEPLVKKTVPPAPAAKPLPAGLLKPIAEVATVKTAVGVTNDFPLAAATPSVVVRSPFVQPGNPNRYLFVIENIGTVDAFGTRVDLRVPGGVVLKQVVADAASSTARRAVVRIDELKAGAKSILEVEVEPTDEAVTFETSLTLETKRSFRGATLPKQRVASSIPAIPAASTAAPAAPAETTLASFTATEATPVGAPETTNANLSATVDGPVLLAAGETASFSITVKNPNYGRASKVVVQLKIPQGLEIVTLDREAWINDEDNTISWEIDSLEARQKETIQYKAAGKLAGQQVQKVTLGMEDVYQGDAKLVTLVSQ